MKRIILIIVLMAMMPSLTMAQKRSKNTTNTVVDASYKFMVITGYTIPASPASNLGSSENKRGERNVQKYMKVTFDSGGSEPLESLSEAKYRSMAHAVNVVAKDGWEFINANVVNSGGTMVHYYYMQKKK